MWMFVVYKRRKFHLISLKTYLALVAITWNWNLMTTKKELKDALNAKFTAAANVSYHGITVTYDTNSNKYKFTDTAGGYLIIQSTSTMNSVIGFESGLIDASVRNTVGSQLKSTVPKTASMCPQLSTILGSEQPWKFIFK